MTPRPWIKDDLGSTPPSDDSSLFELSSDLLGAVEFDGSIKTLNPAWESLLGIPSAELKKTRFTDLFSPEDRPRLVEALQRASEGEAAEPLELRLPRRNASPAWLSWRFMPRPERRLYYVAGRDTTALRALKAERQDDRGMSELGLVAAVIAHDFNNILTVIRGSESLLRVLPGLGPAHVRELDDLSAAVQHGADLIRQVLALSRRMPASAEETDLNEVIARMGWMLRRLGQKRIAIDLVLARRLRRIRVPAVRIEQAMLNLAVNARDAMPEGGRLVIETADLGGQVRLSVTDDGVGIPPELQGRIFEPFFTTKEKGTGLGLASVRRLVDECGGQIRVDSAPGRGTTFELFFPAC